MLSNVLPIIKKYIPLVIWILVGATTIVSIAFVNIKGDKGVCRSVQINITDGAINGFIDDSDIIKLLHETDKYPVGKNIADINMALLETIIETNPYIENAEVFSTLDGMLHIEAEQRDPVIRIFNTHDDSFYIDENGATMPVSDKFSVNVISANGYINENAATMKVTKILPSQADTLTKVSIANQLFYIANTIRCDTFWNAQIVQLYVNQQNEIELVPRVGNHIIQTGGISHFREKLNKLLIFYRKGLNRKGWNDYETVDVRYERQVIGRKQIKVTKAVSDSTSIN